MAGTPAPSGSSNTSSTYSGNTNMVPKGQTQLIAPPTVAPPPAVAPPTKSPGGLAAARQSFGPIGQRRTRYGTWTSTF